LRIKYERELLQRHRLTEQELDDIRKEAMSEQWPLPPPGAGPAPDLTTQPAEQPRSNPPPRIKSEPVPTAAQLEAEREPILKELAEARRIRATEEAKREAEKRAGTLLRNAQSLEDVNRQGAASLYHQIIRDFSGTPQAKTASERVRALELKPY
jgi:hypothetical protein